MHREIFFPKRTTTIELNAPRIVFDYAALVNQIYCSSEPTLLTQSISAFWNIGANKSQWLFNRVNNSVNSVLSSPAIQNLRPPVFRSICSTKVLRGPRIFGVKCCECIEKGVITVKLHADFFIILSPSNQKNKFSKP